ncbi:alpha-D-ribose 1-methylphosphonate 5-triphosphate diphosphatase [Halocynthiibacter sp. C4]|uniref:alpha-D-ribose 1-methylphosphonate 5-triphosphate diphosphatase n=1 Tax=Halocynthiibacter sp. C4 TaxID=2992758 RepID=UPI00237A649A|nr:alpha-D-ribose 1-methylphosphonate 5-triphosphate diphosphatase [Halocynthiibacter sp. C4]MDE0588987.1 alpha-D-ribose 1-methylphosphonate 5-triphosphate diphosphatase [Halocynthiibacter sp. C4]
MTQRPETVLTNANIILDEEVIYGTLTIAGTEIKEITQGRSQISGAIDCDEDFLAPGLIELHTDNLERHMTPRPKVDWPHRAAIVAHDRELAGAGITTVFDAIRVGSITSDLSKKRYGKYARQMADEILSMRDAGALGISHHIHLRAEVCSETLLEELEEFGPDDRVGIVSLMDHTPGQRQFSDLKKFEDYVCGKNGLSRDTFGEYIDFLKGLRDTIGAKHEEATVRAAKRYGATLASHDDTTREQVEASFKHGVTIAEFPTTVEAAHACADQNISVIMGSPNLVRGGSHSGNVAASELADLNRVDILSSDYVPASLLLGALQLADMWDDLPRALATVTKAPALAVGLDDRGVLAQGKRADIIRFGKVLDAPVIRAVWANGDRCG